MRIPIHSPDYRYPPSDNPYWTKLREQSLGKVFSDNETESSRGEWLSRFPGTSSPSRQLHVEIGCNAAHVILEWAQRDPQGAYIGIDWKFKAIFRGLEKINKRKLDNLILFRSHAERLHYMFGPGEIDRLYLFFPDPWPKKAHWKNRFINAERLALLRPLMKPGGIFHIKTDHRGYFDWMEDSVERSIKSGCPWKVQERTNDLHANHPAPETLAIPDVTLFERLFIKDGIRINSMKLEAIPTSP